MGTEHSRELEQSVQRPRDLGAMLREDKVGKKKDHEGDNFVRHFIAGHDKDSGLTLMSPFTNDEEHRVGKGW